ncbi:MAG: 6,7-dimethyl-8-ribityllumazine synthase [Candidatus Brocadiia bacterium]|jgi:6,7-dimethyl-8-ribityllumazine synthase|nr:6,7-dimethyl-8-ribityllumazine synthase [Candidatus Brocadiia bacterium]
MGNTRTHQGSLDAGGKRFALVASRFNEIISSRLISGAIDSLLRHGAEEENIEIYRVPGSFEVPLVARKVAGGGKFHAVICLGAVIRGETPHFDFVAAGAARGVARVALDSGVPVIFGIVTADTLEQAIQRAGGKTGNRGSDAAAAAIETANLLQEMEND